MTTYQPKIGPCMQAVQEFVNENPGCTMMEVARAVGPYNSLQYGYRSVHRAKRAGLIRLEEREDRSMCFRVYPAEEGKPSLLWQE